MRHAHSVAAGSGAHGLRAEAAPANQSGRALINHGLAWWGWENLRPSPPSVACGNLSLSFSLSSLYLQLFNSGVIHGSTWRTSERSAVRAPSRGRPNKIPLASVSTPSSSIASRGGTAGEGRGRNWGRSMAGAAGLLAVAVSAFLLVAVVHQVGLRCASSSCLWSLLLPVLHGPSVSLSTDSSYLQVAAVKPIPRIRIGEEDGDSPILQVFTLQSYLSLVYLISDRVHRVSAEFSSVDDPLPLLIIIHAPPRDPLPLPTPFFFLSFGLASD